ncbi:MAG: GlsB/YeaQ/YmgE family stress response membrane protein [Dokdonella sp.]
MNSTITLQTLIIWLLVGGIAGWLAGLIVRGFGFGLVGNIIIGIIGAFVAGWLLPMAGISIGGGIVGSIIFALIGAVILLVIIGLIKRV